MKLNKVLLGIPLFAATYALLGTGVASAQPGMTPPGSTPPYSAPPPASPGPAGEPGDAQPYGPAQQPGAAQPYGAQQPYGALPPPLPPQERSGFNIGVSLGLGVMESDAGELACNGCEPVAFSFDVHAGKMLSSRFALLGEFGFQGQSLDSSGTSSITQSIFSVAAQYWLHPRLWLKGGLGLSSLSLNYESGFGPESESLGSGVAMHLAAGAELMHTPTFALDVQLKTGAAGYESRDETISNTSINLGVNWY